ncbi:MAG: acyl-CoA/acyl-ACP dehydrogenase [Candidatus Riflebacteria bacterium]|nr:acyl-CoA/acyl-ACP dehydrogenase [Candidatus Riflebacteria bacterium]
MNLEFDERDKELLACWQDFAKNGLNRITASLETESAITSDSLQVLREAGLLKYFLPKNLGGEELGFTSLALLLEEIGQISPITALLIANQVILGIRGFLRYSNDSQREKFAVDAANFENIVSLAVSENNAGSDLSLISTSYFDKTDKFVISGKKAFVNFACIAKSVLVLAKKDLPDQGSEVSMLALALPTDKVKFSPSLPTLGMNGMCASEVDLSEAEVSKSSIFGATGCGIDVFNRLMKEFRICIAAIATGIAQGSFNQAVNYAKTRKQFGKPIGSFQGLQWRFSDHATRIDASRLHVWKAIEEVSEKIFSGRNSAMAKIYSTETACMVTDFALQVLGSSGYVKGSLSEKLFRDSRFLRMSYGSSERLKDFLTDYL